MFLQIIFISSSFPMHFYMTYTFYTPSLERYGFIIQNENHFFAILKQLFCVKVFISLYFSQLTEQMRL